jgi:hypothetical protein
MVAAPGSQRHGVTDTEIARGVSRRRSASQSDHRLARGRGRRTAAARHPADRQETASIREWAAVNDFAVSARGRIPARVREAYANRNNTSAAARNTGGRG